jgi:hypothetical protein
MDGQLKNEILETIKKSVSIFTIQYTKAYVLALVRLIKLESKKKTIDWHLETRPPKNDPLKEGFLTKESVHLKKWNKRYFVFRPNYTVDYYDSQELAHAVDAKSGEVGKKKRNTLNLSGYHVVEDPNQGALVRLKRLAERMGMDFNNLPKPKEYPPLTFEVHHYRRASYYLKAENKEEFDQWVAQFKTACWKARGFSWDDWCHQRAFPIALRKTRWEMGRWGWWSSAGSEEQMLSEMIAEELEYDIMGRIYGKLSGPWIIRNKLRNMALSTIDSMVLSAVKPGWGAMRKAVEAVRPKVEPVIREKLEPIFKLENDIIAKMREAVMSALEPLLKEHVTPHLGKIVGIIKSPMREAYADAINLFDDKISKWTPEADMQRSFRELDYFARSYWQLHPALKKVDDMYDPLWVLREIFSDIYPWSLIWKGHDSVYKHVDNAVYTWEQAMLKQSDPSLAEPIKRDVIIKYRHDTDIAVMRYYTKILKLIIMPPFEAVVHPVTKHIIDPIAEMIPEPMREFIDIKQMFEDLYTGIIEDSIAVVLRAG